MDLFPIQETEPAGRIRMKGKRFEEKLKLVRVECM